MDPTEKEFDADAAFKELVDGLSKATVEQQELDTADSVTFDYANNNVINSGYAFSAGAGLSYPAYSPNISLSSNTFPWSISSGINDGNDADLMIKGRSLSKILDSIEERLAIPVSYTHLTLPTNREV